MASTAQYWYTYDTYYTYSYLGEALLELFREARGEQPELRSWRVVEDAV